MMRFPREFGPGADLPYSPVTGHTESQAAARRRKQKEKQEEKRKAKHAAYLAKEKAK